MIDLRRSAAHLVVDEVALPALDDAADHHVRRVRRVLRCRPGDRISVTDGQGRWRWCVIGESGLEPDSPIHQVDTPAPVTIGVAIPKKDRPEWIVQKLTELGVSRIVFLATERSVVTWSPERAARHLARLERVAIEAVQQSRRVWCPTIEGPLPASTFLPAAVVAEPEGRHLTASDLAIAIGPEGGWTPAELELARDQVSLGDAILRVETAALTAAVLASAVRS